MIISKTPYRVSLFGGGTDYPNWYHDHKGAVLATSIDKYCTVMVREFPSFFDHRYMISYSEIERTNNISEIKHPAIRESIKHLDIDKGLDIHYAGDIPAKTGMGTSSAFTVGFLKTLRYFLGKDIPNYDLALEAIYIEQELINENVGSQDQITSAIGGFNHIDFGDNITVRPFNSSYLKDLENYLMLFFTGFSRTATKIAEEQIKNTNNNISILTEMYDLVFEAEDTINLGNFRDLGRLLDYNWQLKKKLSSKITTEYIDFLYDKAIKSGALGGKLLGAGGGGFLLFLADPDKRDNIIRSLDSLCYVPFKFDNTGSQIIYKS